MIEMNLQIDQETLTESTFELLLEYLENSVQNAKNQMNSGKIDEALENIVSDLAVAKIEAERIIQEKTPTQRL